jgi:PRTRC genetic system protein B
MNTRENITENFGALYHPKSALVFYMTKGTDGDMYVEHFDMDSFGNPVNAHPLTVKEAEMLAMALSTEKDNAFLKAKGILPPNILHINPVEDKGTLVWYTKAQKRQLYFAENLGLEGGTANVPPMVWKASRNRLSVFAVSTNRRPKENTPLYHAPFFNVYDDGNVCIGTVSIDFENSASAEEFMTAWETYFFNSYFTHLLGSRNHIVGNCMALWKSLIGTDEPFPKNILRKNYRKLKNLLR